MEKKRIIAVVVAISTMVVLLVAGVLLWFLSPGVHFLGKFAHFDLEEADCYIISKENGTIRGQTTLTLTGFENDYLDGTMSGWSFEIPGYVDILEEQIIDDLVAMRHNGEWTVMYSSYENWEGDILASQAERAAGVDAQIRFVEDVPVVWVHYGSAWKRADVYAVCADSEEAALAIYQEYIRE